MLQNNFHISKKVPLKDDGESWVLVLWHSTATLGSSDLGAQPGKKRWKTTTMRIVFALGTYVTNKPSAWSSLFCILSLPFIYPSSNI